MSDEETTEPKKLWLKLQTRTVGALNQLSDAMRRRNTRALIRFMVILASLVTVNAIIFQGLMAYEGQKHSWVTGFYWTLSTMSTLGYGDISFFSDLGRIFSIVVLLLGIIFMLVLLPFTFIELFYEPWMEARAASQVPRAAPTNHEWPRHTDFLRTSCQRSHSQTYPV